MFSLFDIFYVGYLQKSDIKILFSPLLTSTDPDVLWASWEIFSNNITHTYVC